MVALACVDGDGVGGRDKLELLDIRVAGLDADHLDAFQGDVFKRLLEVFLRPEESRFVPVF